MLGALGRARASARWSATPRSAYTASTSSPRSTATPRSSRPTASPTEIAHLFGKPGVFPVDHDLLKAALVLIVAAPAVAHLARLRLGRGLGLDAAGDLGHEHLAAGLVHPVAAAARGRRARPPPARRRRCSSRRCSSSTRSRRCSRRCNERGLDTASARSVWERLPAWLRPRAVERPRSGRTRLVETTLLVLAGLLLAIATVNDVVRQTHVNQRLIADLRTWRAYTGHDYHNLSIEQELLGEHEPTRGRLRQHEPRGRRKRDPAVPAICGAGGATGGARSTAAGTCRRRPKTCARDRYGCFGPAVGGKSCPR